MQTITLKNPAVPDKMGSGSPVVEEADVSTTGVPKVQLRAVETAK